MKSLSRLSVLSAVAAAAMTLPFQSVSAEAPKREMRSAWVATVWQLDWPQTTISSTGNETQVEAQKEQMIALLDSLANNNMNAVNFQVRSRCDAMYKSSYEPWSSDLVSSRGMDPGYDPLAFVVEESHKRGLECHAWVNPYRYESVAGQWSGMAGDIRAEHPDWIMDNDGAAILNPGKQEVIDYITEICREIVKKGNFAKFSQSNQLMEYLLGTGNKILVEASPKDTIWGIGLSEDSPKACNPHLWRGENLLGFALMDVRDMLNIIA